MSTITLDERRKLCEEFGLDPLYLYQLVTGRREMSPIPAVELEERTMRRLRRWHLRAKTWHRVWPELVGSEGAPPVPEDDGVVDVAHGGNVDATASESTPSQTVVEKV